MHWGQNVYFGANCSIEETRQRGRPWLALLLSAAAHAAVVIALSSEGGAAGGAAGELAVPHATMMVRLVAAARPAAVAVQQTVLAQEAAPASRATPPAQAPVPAAATAPEPPAAVHYFGAAALTQEPKVLGGLVDDKLLIVPGITPQAVSVQVWLGGQGEVEKVVLETDLTPEQERLMREAFGKVRFSPGRIGRIAVRSKVALQLLLEDAMRL